VSWLDVNQADRLETISAALRQYAAVFTTNYDLLVYWAMMIDGAGTGFGDLFWNSSHTFDPFDTEVRDHKTIVYWLHGGLHLFTNTWGQAEKRAGGALNLLEAFASALSRLCSSAKGRGDGNGAPSDGPSTLNMRTPRSRAAKTTSWSSASRSASRTRISCKRSGAIRAAGRHDARHQQLDAVDLTIAQIFNAGSPSGSGG
jgi:hypothetical protein